jgi:chemotaxis protein MotB
MARKKKGGGGHGGGGHGWFATFADLMGLLVAFFVMLVAFSNTDQKKMNIVAGSMREAFGTQTAMRYSGMVELDGLPTRARLKNVDPNVKPEDTSATPSPDEKSRSNRFGARLDNEGNFALASASLRQAMQDLPEVSEISKHIMFEETKQGLNIEIMDQNGSSMFPEGSKEPFERTRRLVQRLASGLKTLPYRMTIAGHTSATRQPGRPGYGSWDLSADRANAVRKILEEEGVPAAKFFMVAGRSDTQPLFPDDPFVAANRRVTITLMQEAPPLPTSLRP